MDRASPKAFSLGSGSGFSSLPSKTRKTCTSPNCNVRGGGFRQMI